MYLPIFKCIYLFWGRSTLLSCKYTNLDFSNSTYAWFYFQYFFWSKSTITFLAFPVSIGFYSMHWYLYEYIFNTQVSKNFLKKMYKRFFLFFIQRLKGSPPNFVAWTPIGPWPHVGCSKTVALHIVDRTVGNNF